ncbi:hypothetical protein [Lysinibacter cavernae]|uniref:Gram-positive cocci surface proteins LPxTG domain-containing protein n=1 Tax=Lysinibacter cavernae TaxID=1640652 RepID=A0A7X5TSF4_9MICO|nr:hypothetical protein [Lysinibacter cavernae]NIH53451.1 hypothetical protein [Lysinibacter cavernae]
MPLLRGRLRATILAVAAIAAIVTTGVMPAQAINERQPLTDLRLDIAPNQEYQQADSLGHVCNYFSAGEESAFREELGNVSIVKLAADGSAQRASKANICLPMEGKSINQRARFLHGDGALDPVTGAGEVRWSGAFTANAYGGLVPWTVKDPVLSVGADGSGELRAVAGGFGANMENPEGGFPLRSREVVLATFASVSIGTGAIEIAPDFAGRDYFPLNEPGVAESGRSATSAIPAENKGKPGWGSWPESFVDFHYESGLASYWHTSGGSADPNKAPMPLRVVAGGDAGTERPIITANPASNLEFPVLEGNNVMISASATGARGVFWERKDSKTEPWRAIQGANEEKLALPSIGSEWNGVSVRFVAENAAGQSYSAELRLQTETPRELRIDQQPGAVLAIEGMRPVLDVTASGTPGPTVFVVERSFDQGETWATLDGVTQSRSTSGSGQRLLLPPADAVGNSQVRVLVSNRLGQSVRTEATAYRVVAATGKPQIVLGSDSVLDPAVGGTVTVVGANISVPPSDGSGSYSLDVALFEDADWQPGMEGSRNWIATSPDSEWGQLYPAELNASGGAFTVSITVAAGDLDAERSHGVATFLRHTNLWWQESFTDRSADSYTRLAIAAPDAAPVEIPESQLTEENRGGLTAEVTADGMITATVLGQRADSNVYLSVRSESTGLGWTRLDEGLTASAPLPIALEPGIHRVIVQDVSGALLGWASFEVTETVKPVDPTITPRPNEPSSTDQPAIGANGENATGGVHAAGGLAATGGGTASAALAAGSSAALLGAILLLRRRKQA